MQMYVTWPIPHSDTFYSSVQEPVQGQSLVNPSQSLVNPSQSLVQSLMPKNADFGGFIGKEGVIFFNETLQGSYWHTFKWNGILRIGPEAIWKNDIFSCGPPTTYQILWLLFYIQSVKPGCHRTIMNTAKHIIYSHNLKVMCSAPWESTYFSTGRQTILCISMVRIVALMASNGRLLHSRMNVMMYVFPLVDMSGGSVSSEAQILLPLAIFDQLLCLQS